MKEYIEREAAINKFQGLKEGASLRDTLFLCGVQAALGSIPSADVAPVVHARWSGGACTNCGHYGFPTEDGDNERTPFCPLCGARMDKEEKA